MSSTSEILHPHQIIAEFSEDLCRLLEASIEKADRKLWAELRKKGEERDELVERAETSAREAE